MEIQLKLYGSSKILSDKDALKIMELELSATWPIIQKEFRNVFIIKKYYFHDAFNQNRI